VIEIRGVIILRVDEIIFTDNLCVGGATEREKRNGEKYR
jgi:hypothetical protein